MLKEMWRSIISVFDNAYAIAAGFIASILGYFLPLKDIVHLMLLFFILDVIFGFWAAKKLRKEKFSVRIIWAHTIPRMILAVITVIMLFLWDNVFSQNLVSTYKIGGWFICGILVSSVVENGWKITRWLVFPKIRKLVEKEIKKEV